MSDDSGDVRPVGTVRGDYVWDGTGWVPQVDSLGSTFDGFNWHRASAPSGPGVAAPQPQGFAHPYYAYGLTRRAADDIHFLARYMKIVVIIGLILGAVYLVLVVLILGGLFGTLAAIVP